MKLLNNYIMVEKLEEQANDGLQLASATDALVACGKVVEEAVFSSLRHDESLVGKKVYFIKYAGDEHDYQGRKVRFIKFEDVIGYE